MNGKTARGSGARTPAVPAVLNDPVRNRGVASTEAEREALGRTERLPNRVRTPLVLTYGGTADMPTSKA